MCVCACVRACVLTVFSSVFSLFFLLLFSPARGETPGQLAGGRVACVTATRRPFTGLTFHTPRSEPSRILKLLYFREIDVCTCAKLSQLFEISYTPSRGWGGGGVVLHSSWAEL